MHHHSYRGNLTDASFFTNCTPNRTSIEEPVAHSDSETSVQPLPNELKFERAIDEIDKCGFQNISKEIKSDVKSGSVVDCKKLNVRKEPRENAAIIYAIAFGTELMIDETESTEDFYKVCTAAGIEGFCMRNFIEISS